MKLQVILMIIFGIVGVVAVLIFGGILPGFKQSGSAKGPTVVLWGTFPSQEMDRLLYDLNQDQKYKSYFQITYKQIDARNYRETILNALASQSGPDIWITTQDLLLGDKSKISRISLDSMTERDFRNNFIDGAEILLNYDVNPDTNNTTKNIIGLPLAIDPIILYWNKDIFSSAGISEPPKTWDDFLTSVQSLTQKDAAQNIIVAGTALGKFNNVKNAKEIISLMMMQGGDNIIRANDSGGLDVVFGEKIGKDNLVSPAESALRFFTEFSNPSKVSYSWNGSLPSSEIMFSNNSLAMYFGYASEAKEIIERNPHVNFDVSEIPQIKDAKINILTFGKIYSLVIAKNSSKKQAAFYAINALTSPDFQRKFSQNFNLGSSRRDVLSEKVQDPFLAVVYKSAIKSKAWLDPDPQKTSEIFRSMIESVTTGRTGIGTAIFTAQKQLEDLIR